VTTFGICFAKKGIELALPSVRAISVCYNPVEVAGFLEAIQQVVIVG